MEDKNYDKKRKLRNRKMPLLLLSLLLVVTLCAVVIYFNQDKLSRAAYSDAVELDNTIAEEENNLQAENVIEEENNTSVENIINEEPGNETAYDTSENTAAAKTADKKANTSSTSKRAKKSSADAVAPISVVSYSTTKPTDQDVTVTIASNQELKSLTGWTLSADKKSLTKVYHVNKAETVTIENLKGVKNSVTVEVKNINISL